MSQRLFVVALLFAVPLAVGCRRIVEAPPSAHRAEDTRDKTEPDRLVSPGDPALPAGEDVLRSAARMNADHSVETVFRSGHANPIDFEGVEVTKDENGFTIQLPAASPVPTPTIYQDRLYVSGGFSSQEFYCFDAYTADPVWAAQLDDDGPSSAVPYDDSIIFGCESCTIFVLAAKTGEMRWSRWLGDPLLSMPTVAGNRVFTVYPAVPSDAEGPADPPDDMEATNQPAAAAGVSMTPTHIAVCFDARTGETLWQKWIDSDCMTAPAAVEDDLYVATLTGTVYRFAQRDGKILSARRFRATSVPVVADDRLFLTRRDDAEDGEVAECIASHDASTYKPHYIAARRLAPYLDQAVQRAADYSNDAVEFESSNGIGGGFGGGFGGDGGFGGNGGGGFFAVQEEEQEPTPVVPGEQVGPTGALPAQSPAPDSLDPLVRTERQAAENFGLGNVSTLQAFQGSRVLHWNGRLVNCMGDQIVCTSAQSGEQIWSRQIEGDLNQIGGHLGTPPVAAGAFLFVATVQGTIMQLKGESGDIVKLFQVGSAVRFPPVVHRGRIYVGTQDGRVVCLDTGDQSLTGWPMWGRDAARRNVAAAD